jgi:Glycerophosphoryl diester phosphodiesterase family
MILRERLAILAVICAVAACGDARGAQPQTNAHAHNDYWHDRPLFDALDRGFTSVEADIFVIEGKLLIGHEREGLNPERTLESLYLEPLARRVEQNGGRVHNHGRRFFLLIDIKSESSASYTRVHEVLLNYAAMLTSVDDGDVRQGAVTVVITGNRPSAETIAAEPQLAGLDGRLSNLDSDLPPHLMPMISDKWSDHFTWNGDGEMPASERGKLRGIVEKAHKAGRVVRFWATPERQSVWRELQSAGVDLIGTDRLDQLAMFLGIEAQPPAK